MKKLLFVLLAFVEITFAGSTSSTLQKKLSFSYHYFENLYFDTNTSTFIAKGRKIPIREAIFPDERRGFCSKVSNANMTSSTFVEGTTFFLLEAPATTDCRNQFSCFLEHIVGIWSFYADTHNEDVKNIVLCGDGKADGTQWEGPNKISYHFLHALFPKATVITWKDFLQKNEKTLLCFERAVTSDREFAMQSSENKKNNESLEDARRLFSSEALTHMSERIHSYAGTIHKLTHTIRITYLVDPTSRVLAPEAERYLLESLKNIEGVSLQCYDFSQIPFHDQIQIIGNTDVFFSLHGSGLNYILFLPPFAKVIEIDPVGWEGRFFAEAKGLNYCHGTIDELDIGSILDFVGGKRKKYRILLGSPIRQKPLILQEFLQSLDRLEKVNYTIDYFFIEGNDHPESKKLLADFAKDKGSRCLLFSESEAMLKTACICNESTHYWREDIIWKIASFKDQMIQKAKEEKYNYLFLVDSDLVLHPHTLEQLILAKKDIITNNFWTKWTPDSPPLPQVWVSDHYTLFHHEINEQLTQEEIHKRTLDFLQMLQKPGVYEVGGLGACTLISQEALNRGVSFARIKNLTFWGEDRHFCIRAAALGLTLHADTHYPAYHIYRESELAGVEEFKKKVCHNIQMEAVE